MLKICYMVCIFGVKNDFAIFKYAINKLDYFLKMKSVSVNSFLVHFDVEIAFWKVPKSFLTQKCMSSDIFKQYKSSESLL